MDNRRLGQAITPTTAFIKTHQIYIHESQDRVLVGLGKLPPVAPTPHGDANVEHLRVTIFRLLRVYVIALLSCINSFVLLFYCLPFCLRGSYNVFCILSACASGTCSIHCLLTYWVTYLWNKGREILYQNLHRRGKPEYHYVRHILLRFSTLVSPVNINKINPSILTIRRH